MPKDFIRVERFNTLCMLPRASFRALKNGKCKPPLAALYNHFLTLADRKGGIKPRIQIPYMIWYIVGK